MALTAHWAVFHSHGYASLTLYTRGPLYQEIPTLGFALLGMTVGASRAPPPTNRKFLAVTEKNERKPRRFLDGVYIKLRNYFFR